MKESEKEEAKHWLGKFTPIYEESMVAVRVTANLGTESSPEDWDKAYSNESVRVLMSAKINVKELPKPKQKELRKLKNCYTDLVTACVTAGHLYLKAYYDEHLGRVDYHKMIFFTSMAGGLLKDFSKGLEKIRQEIEAV